MTQALPEKIEQIFASLSVETQFISPIESEELTRFEIQEEYAKAYIQIIYLKDEIGLVQALIAKNQILDLNHFKKELERSELKPLSKTEESKFKNSDAIDELAPIIQLRKAPAYIDSNLIKNTHLFITTGHNKWAKIEHKNFKKMYGQASVLPIGVTVKSHQKQSESRDYADVNQAIMQFTALRIKQRLNETLDLPPLPETAKRIMDLRSDVNADPASLATAIELDPAMSAQVVSWARSPFYGANKDSVKTVEDAILRVLGFDLVMNLALGLALGKTIKAPRNEIIGYSSFWQQSVMVATLCAELSLSVKTEEKPSYGLAYLCGLMHNFGYLILAQIFPPQFQTLSLYMRTNRHIDDALIEQHLLGMTQEQISSLLFKQWALPEELVNAVRHQKNVLFDGSYCEYPLLINLANQALRRQGYGHGPVGELSPEILFKLNITADEVEEKAALLVSQLDTMSAIVAALNKGG